MTLSPMVSTKPTHFFHHLQCDHERSQAVLGVSSYAVSAWSEFQSGGEYSKTMATRNEKLFAGMNLA